MNNQQLDINSIFYFMVITSVMVMGFRLMNRSMEPAKEQPAKMLSRGNLPSGYKSLASSNPGHSSSSAQKPTRDDVSVDSWAERDRIGIWVTDRKTNKTIAEWWDDDARQMFEDGFFKPATFTSSGELGGAQFIDSVLDYLEDVSILSKAREYSPNLGSRVKNRYHGTYLTNWQYGGYSYIEEDTDKSERLWIRSMADYVNPNEVITIAEREGLQSISLAGGFWKNVGYRGWGEKVSINEAKIALAKAKKYVLG